MIMNLNTEWSQDLLFSIILLTGILFFRHLVIKSLKVKSKMSGAKRRKWIVRVRNLSLFTLFFGLAILWSSEIQTAALSLVAIAAALAISLKEVISNIMGGFLRATTRPFNIGDRIEMGSIRGDVIDSDLFNTTVLEIGPGHLTHQYTGRSVTIPNSLFLTQPVINETFMDDYVLHVFAIPLPRESDWSGAEEKMLAIATAECAPYKEEAQKYMRSLGKREGIKSFSVEPLVYLHFPDEKTTSVVLRIPAPAARKGRIEQSIIRKFFAS